MPKVPSSNLFDLIASRGGGLDQLALETSDATALTYAGLFQRSAQAANALVGLGVKPGDRVAMQVDKSTDVIALMLACLRAGAPLLPLNTAYTLAELEYFLGDARPALTLCRPGSLDAIRSLARKLDLPAVESLGVMRDGNLRRPDRGIVRGVRNRPPRRRRSRGDPLHFRHDGPFQGGDAQP